jgi:FG-GAP-like repeat
VTHDRATPTPPLATLASTLMDAADFNGDGKADILWQNADGTPAVWLMNGLNVVSGANVGFDPGTNWHVIPQHHDLLV